VNDLLENSTGLFEEINYFCNSCDLILSPTEKKCGEKIHQIVTLHTENTPVKDVHNVMG